MILYLEIYTENVTRDIVELWSFYFKKHYLLTRTILRFYQTVAIQEKEGKKENNNNERENKIHPLRNSLGKIFR